MLLWHPMHLHCLDIHCCRCSFLDQSICNLLFFELADAFQPSCHVNCIYILPFLGLEDTSFANFASASHIFDNLQIPFAEIRHLQSLKTHYRRYHRLISFEFYFSHLPVSITIHHKVLLFNSSSMR